MANGTNTLLKLVGLALLVLGVGLHTGAFNCQILFSLN
jgi:hypothetical protein